MEAEPINMTKQELAYIIAKQYAFLFSLRPFLAFSITLDIANESAFGHSILFDDELFWMVDRELAAHQITLGIITDAPGVIVLCEESMNHVNKFIAQPFDFVA